MSATKASSASLKYQSLIQILRTADALWNASRVFFARWDVSPSQFNVLNLLSDQPDGMSQTELGRLLLTHRSNVTGLVDRLEKRRLLARKENAGDRRAYRVVITNEGKRLVNEILPEFHTVAERIWGETPAVRARELARDLSQLGNNAQRFGKVET